MNSSGRLDSWSEALSKHVITFVLSFTINCINGAFVYTFFKSRVFQQDPRYVLYVHLVINDMIMLTLSVALQIMSYTIHLGFAPCCIIVLITITIDKNSPLNLAGMAVERYIAVCRPLHHVQICTVLRAYTLIVLIWVVSFITTFPNLIIIFTTQPVSIFSRNVICHTLSVFNTPYHNTLSTVVQVLLFSFIFLTVIITYIKVLSAAQVASGSNQASARNARNTIALHGVQLLICMLSFISPLFNLFLITIWPRKRTNIYYTTFLLTNMLPRLLSPFIYGVRDKKFRSHIRLHFCSCCNLVEKQRVMLIGPQRRNNQ